MQSRRGGTVHTPAHIFFHDLEKSNRAGWRLALANEENKIVHMKRPAKRMPMATRTPSCVKPRVNRSGQAQRKPTAVRQAPKKNTRPSFDTGVAIRRDGVSPFNARLLVTPEDENCEIDA